jgi:serine/threonine protein kinase
LAGDINVLSIHWFNLKGDFHVIISDLLNPSLKKMFNFYNRQFSFKTILLLADQFISRIKYIYNKSFLHRYIKPENFYFSKGILRNRVNVANFGLAKTYFSLTDFHIPYIENISFDNIARYASPNVYNGIEYFRRDNIISLKYVLLYFYRGFLF